jgi:hypothetical protein
MEYPNRDSRVLRVKDICLIGFLAAGLQLRGVAGRFCWVFGQRSREDRLETADMTRTMVTEVVGPPWKSAIDSNQSALKDQFELGYSEERGGRGLP